MFSVHAGNDYLGHQADSRVHQHPDNPVEVVVYRDPDGRGADGLDVAVVINGRLTDATLYVVDPGAGYPLDEWRQDRDAEVARASRAAGEVIASFYDTGEETTFIERDDPEPTDKPTDKPTGAQP